MLLWWPCTKIVQAIMIHKKTWVLLLGVGLIFPIYLNRKLQKSSCQKPLNRFQYYLAGMFLWWPSTKFVQAVMIRQKTWPLGVGLIFLIQLYETLQKPFCQKPLDHFQYNLAELFLWWPSFKIQVKPSWCLKKKWLLGSRPIKFIQKS